MVAVAEIWTSFRDPEGRPYFGLETIEPELAGVQQALAAGQTAGRLGELSPRVLAVSLKGALDALLTQLIADPEVSADYRIVTYDPPGSSRSRPSPEARSVPPSAIR